MISSVKNTATGDFILNIKQNSLIARSHYCQLSAKEVRKKLTKANEEITSCIQVVIISAMYWIKIKLSVTTNVVMRVW